MKHIALIVLAFAIITLAGCSGWSWNKGDTIIDQDIIPPDNGYGVVATQADRRLVITKVADGPGGNKKSNVQSPAHSSGRLAIPTSKIANPLYICAEPFPDGAARFQQLESLKLTDLTNKINKAVKKKNIERERAINIEVSIPYELDRAIKFYRDGVFALCQAAMNGWVRTTETSKCGNAGKLNEFECQLFRLRKAVVEILQAESSAKAKEAKAEAEKSNAEKELELYRIEDEQINEACKSDKHKEKCKELEEQRIKLKIAKMKQEEADINNKLSP